ncbi:hypothetical protein MNEG_0200 [Monoraphidium neglectum]|jgi:tRNA(adenine34) deaminase|uniref:CMP/dCMP-type deaminase domain-containing protein n=1 Tax=Monoraphidium neglectum TaxID=145388 RepID=A0A0D2MZB7_9CHLO|nr:hypothetical protein MNEG_0200 [Monoraphidium neglectum]KIZ07755.1 hypothetical protein MNEG_0200 [Monoraphidium neglectum]|eukprot:XP_013906774.1 hypothetical protein MNEG_0200 [Monoraphidium neglectum]
MSKALSRGAASLVLAYGCGGRLRRSGVRARHARSSPRVAATGTLEAAAAASLRCSTGIAGSAHAAVNTSAAAAVKPDGNAHDGSTDCSDADACHMRRALALARRAFEAGEVPVGAVVVDDQGSVVAEAHNMTEATQNPLAHAELVAIQAAAAAVGGWRLAGCTLYVSLEPCPMCAGAILNARLRRVCYGARSPRVGADGGWIRMLPPYPAAAAAEGATAGGSGGCCEQHQRGDHPQVLQQQQPPQQQQRQRQHQKQQHEPPQRQQQRGESGEPWDAFAAVDGAFGAAAIRPLGPHPFHPALGVTRGLLRDECAELLRAFFRRRRHEAEERRRLLMQVQRTSSDDEEA